MALTDAEKAAADTAEHQRAIEVMAAVRAARQADVTNTDKPGWAVKHRRWPELFQFHTEAAARGLVAALPQLVGLSVLKRTTDGWEIQP